MTWNQSLIKGIVANRVEISQVLSIPFQFLILFEKNEANGRKDSKTSLSIPFSYPVNINGIGL